MKTSRTISLLLLCAFLSSLISCGEAAAPADTSAQTDSAVTTEKPEYDFPQLDCNGDEFTILNSEEVWNMYTNLDFEEQTGEILDDTVYARNRKIEDLFNVDLNVIEGEIDKLASSVKESVMSGDATYDAAYIKGEHIGGVITDGCLTDLSTIPGLQLDKDWWNQNVLETAKIGKKGTTYFAVNDLSLTGFDLTWCLMFNETMLENLNIDKPYDLVRSGKWTLDAFNGYIKDGMNLNGDSSFAWDENGKSIYGFTTYANYLANAMTGAECYFIKNNKDGTPELVIENDRFFNFCDKYVQITATDGAYKDANSGNMHYEKIFKAGRALFVGGEIKASAVFRDFEDTFGILPAPKLDENQKEYHSWINYLTLLLTVPVTNENLERTGIILDALSYLSTREVLPVYYDITVSQKGLRNDDSIEMLDIIRDSRYFDASLAYGWTSSLYGVLKNSLTAGTNSASSQIAAAKDAIQENISNTMKKVNG